jgi:hypothetical protein
MTGSLARHSSRRIDGGIAGRRPALRRRITSVALIAATLSCDSWRARRVDAALTQAATRAIGTTFRFDSLAPFQWDTVWVFQPYTMTPSDTDHAALRAAAGTSIEYQDHSNVLVFMAGSDPKAVVDHLRHRGSFNTFGKRAFSRNEASFTLCYHVPFGEVTFAAGPRDSTVACTPQEARAVRR